MTTEPYRHYGHRDKPCNERCVCPVHGTQLLYAPWWDKHACQDPECIHRHGMVTDGQRRAGPMNPLSKVTIRVPVPPCWCCGYAQRPMEVLVIRPELPEQATVSTEGNEHG